jgi:menaquinol-cytochrome c reductase iron-sulfur subunit
MRAIYTIPALIGGTLVACVGNYLFGKTSSVTNSWADAGEVADIQKGSPHQVRFERAIVDGWKLRTQESSAWVVIDAQQRVTAFAPACTHLGCAYGWRAEKNLFVCPCHGSEFNIQGEVTTGPATRALDRYSTKLEGNRLWLGPVKRTEGA